MEHFACPGPQMVSRYPLHEAFVASLFYGSLFAVHPIPEGHPLSLRQPVSGLQTLPDRGYGGRVMPEGGRLLDDGAYGGPGRRGRFEGAYSTHSAEHSENKSETELYLPKSGSDMVGARHEKRERKEKSQGPEEKRVR